MKSQHLEFLGSVYDWSSANARDLVRFGGAEEFSQLGYARELRAILTDRFRLYFGNFRIWWYLVFVHCSLLIVTSRGVYPWK